MSQMKTKKPELLAPAGDYGCFQAALKAGADAVYIGGQQYGARAYAGNFSRDEVLSALDEAHFYGKKIYLTVNTLMKQEELDRLADFIVPFYEEGLDGVIVQDVGALCVLGRNFPRLPLHASTQMTVTDAAGAQALKRLGIVRVVPARELSLEEAALLKKESGLEVEVFIHGAMCYCYSGQCLFSSMLGGRSGNRGRCAQPCRQPYRIRSEKMGKACYPLSLKDLCTIDLIPELIDAGIDSFKIEGRMKRAEYVAGVTDVYRRRIEAYLEHPERKTEVPLRDRKLLSSLYVRGGLESGYLNRHNGREMVTMDQPGYAGCGDELLQDIRSRLLERSMELPVSLTASLAAGKPFRLTARAGEAAVSLEGEIVQQAQKRPLTEDEVKRQLAKTGGSGFRAEEISVSLEGETFLPVKAMNELRRSALEKLRDGRTDAYRRSGETAKSAAGEPVKMESMKTAAAPSAQPSARKLSASVVTLSQLEACLKAGVSRIYVPLSFQVQMEERLREAREKGPDSEIFLALPVILRAEARARMGRIRSLLDSGLFDGALVASPSGLVWLQEIGWKGKVAFDHRIYIWNRQTWEYWKEEMDTYCAPLELNGRDIRALPAPGPGERGRKEVLVYGRIPMMVTANCVRKTAGECPKDTSRKNGGAESLGEEGFKENGRENSAGGTALIDRFQAEFPVVTDCRFCYNIIYNSVPLSLHGFPEELRESGAAWLRFDFLEESGRETEEVIRLFEQGLSGEKVQPGYAFTTGHFRKGAK
ncbi:MAG TPA: U32 family peptidase [Candidatus Eisenbergiella merdavium]|uniref:U32 family peptidase n=1 Tax=Candidatus Eisenbergiella merdavium TaxID=2838551 RepID=A0A9D2NGQ7_9FIRM|nr:U32 family peptidase [Candidatus Eisenbergiella merdavium]